MKEIILVFKTKKGEVAYHRSDDEGKKASYMERRAVRCLFKDSIISKDPLTVKIKIKSQRMALTLDLPEQIEKGLRKFGAEKDTDYTMQVS